MDIILENSQGLKGMIRGMLTENEKLKAQVCEMGQCAPSWKLVCVAVPDLPTHPWTGGYAARVTRYCALCSPDDA